MTSMDLRPQIAAVVDDWAKTEHRATFLPEPLHDRCKRSLVDRIETLLRDIGVSTVPQMTPKVEARPKRDPLDHDGDGRKGGSTKRATEGATNTASTSAPETPVNADDAEAMAALKGKLKGNRKGKQ
jgi:hypothetical protein